MPSPAATAPVPFIQIRDGKYEVGQQAEEFFQQIREPVSVVIIAGKYRTGKSLLVNRCFLPDHEREGRFSVGDTVNSCTKGIWVYPRVVTTPSSHKVVVMDSEGIGSLDADATHDTKIFALALLLSSQFIYNSVGSIDEAAISTLSLVLQVSRQIQMGSGGGAGGDQDLAAVMPRFNWVVRDFALKLVDPDGGAITPDQYLEAAIAPTPDPDRNQVREAIRACFPTPKRRCHTLVRPCVDEDDLQRMNALPDSALRPEFVNQLEQLRLQVWRDAATPKTLMGEAVTGSMLVEFARALCTAINAGVAPVIRDSWALMCEVKNRDLYDAHVADFRDEVAGWSSSSVLPRVMSESLHAKRDQAARLFRTDCASTPGTAQLAEKFEQATLDILRGVLAQVQSNFDQALHEVLQTANRDIQALHGGDDTQALRDTLSRVERDLKHRVGDNDDVAQVIRARLLPVLLDFLEHQEGSGTARAALEEHIRDLETRLAKTREECQEKITRTASDHDREIQGLRDRHRDELADKDRSLEDCTQRHRAAQQEAEEARRAELALEEQAASLRSRVTELEETASTHGEEDYARQLALTESMSNEIKKLKSDGESLRYDLGQSQERMRREQELHQMAVDELQGAYEDSMVQCTDRHQEVLRALTQERDRTASELEEEQSAHRATRQEMTEVRGGLERRAEAHKRELANAEAQLANERRHVGQLTDQADAARAELAKLLADAEARMRERDGDHQAETAKLREKHALDLRELQESARTTEGELGQARERLASSKRRIEGMEEESREAKRLRHALSDSQRENIKVAAQNEYLRTDKEEREKRLNSERDRYNQLAERTMEVEKRLVIEVAKAKM
jgi:hypothetical protein